ncbi:MAG TPA: replication-relaxation family protein [Solirubrobacteraceae bacterium]|nr:replication-relaxation family protein [Solirubrobacteraceae bacterium]
MLRFLLWRMLGVLAVLLGIASLAWLFTGGPGEALRGRSISPSLHLSLTAGATVLGHASEAIWRWTPVAGVATVQMLSLSLLATSAFVISTRALVRSRRRYVRLVVQAYRTDEPEPEALVRMFEALHKRMLRRWWRRLLQGQPSVALEVHHTGTGNTALAWFGVSCPLGLESMIETALQGAYPNCRLTAGENAVGVAPHVLRLKKREEFILRGKPVQRFAYAAEPAVNRLLSVMGACDAPAFVQLSLTPTPPLFESFARHAFKRREARISRERREHLVVQDRSMVQDAELRGGLEVQHRPLFFVDLRVIAPSRLICERIASELRVNTAENRLIERGTALRHGVLGMYARRVQRGEGNPLPPFSRGVFAATELSELWQLPSVDYTTVPFARSSLPLAPAPPGIYRPPVGAGALRDARGPISIHVELRRQNTAVPGTVEQGKSSYLVATVAEDVARERCAVIVLDPKGDAADAALSVVPTGRTCTLLDFAHPTCGFNPLAVDAPADVIADYVVGALKNLFTDADIRASSDRYLRNAIIAVLAHDRSSTLWDAARLLSVGEEGYAYRRAVGASVRTMPEFKEISEFFTSELTAQLADSRSTTTAKLDAPVNKLARLLNSASIKRVLLNESLKVDFDRVIANQEVLIVKGALGAMGAGNTSVLMQLLLGMLDAALARQQDLVAASQRVAIALKVDEAPLVINRGFAETMALKRSAGLETVACWQTDAQWVDRDVREQLDALFAHRVYFATASARDARAAVELTMAEFSDVVRPGIEKISSLGRPDVRLHLPKHHAIASWSTADGRQSPFIAQTLPLTVEGERLVSHARAQHQRGGRHLTDLRQPHWDRGDRSNAPRADSDERAPSSDAPSGATRVARVVVPPTLQTLPALPDTPAEGYRELVELDRAQSVRRAPRRVVGTLDPDPRDLEVLALIGALGHVLSSQIHRRINPGRSPTTTQRRLKRLADAGLVERFQFHRRDGGGVPMCYTLTTEGRDALQRQGGDGGSIQGGEPRAPIEDRHRRMGISGMEARLKQARHEIHVAAWVLALADALSETGTITALRGAEEALLPAPQRTTPAGRVPVGPGDLRLPGGRAPHDFLRTETGGRRVQAERFETLRPDTIVEISGAVDLIVEREDRLERPGTIAKLERYDHFLAGWSTLVKRYGPRGRAVPFVVYLCRDRQRARECARRADALLCACRAYAGEYPFDWEYQGREQTLFVPERDVHEGLLLAYRIPSLPPAVRVTAAQGDPRAAERTALLCELPSLMPGL